MTKESFHTVSGVWETGEIKLENYQRFLNPELKDSINLQDKKLLIE